MIYAKIIADSIAENGRRLTTVECQYQRFIHGEVMTHRVFSRNAMSSRALPVAKMIDQVRNNPAMPVHWGANQAGMQANNQLEGEELAGAEFWWRKAAERAAAIAEELSNLGLHKQVANRILEPFQWMRIIITATQWENFFDLRLHKDAQPEIQELARCIRHAMDNSTPVVRMCPKHLLNESALNWHLPYVTEAERHTIKPDLLPRVSAARCARVSYLTHSGENPDTAKDLALFERLVGSVPLHASPIEHQAAPMRDAYGLSNNFRGWRQFRETYEHSLQAAV